MAIKFRPVSLPAKVYSGDRIVEQIQDSVADSLRSVQQSPILNYNLIELFVSPSVDIKVLHKLNRKLSGYAIHRADADVRVWESATTNPNPDKQLILRASAAANITLYVY